MKICGNYSGSVTSVQYSTDGTTWNALNNTALASPFCYYQNANVGRFNLSIRVNGDSSSNKTIYNVSVGDLFLITGQSNAVGVGTGGNNTANASDPYAPVMFKSGVWQLATDPTSPAGGYGSPWMHFADNLTQQFSIPIGIINSAELGYQISNWNYNGLMTNITNGTLSNATNGTMRVKAVLFYQGETGLVPRYYENMTNMVSWMSSSFNVSASKVVYIGLTSPCGNYFGRDDNDLIRKAQLLVRTSNPLVGEGAVSYMINKNGSTLYDNCHFTTNASIRAHSDQWVREVLGQVYGVGDAIGAVPVSLVLSPTDNSSLTLTFNKAVQILNENYTPSTLAKGIRIDNGTANLTDANVISTTVSGASVVIVLNQNISNNSTMTYASYEDTNAKPVFMSLNNIPVMPFFNYPITAATLHPSGLSGMNLVLAGVLVMLYILLLAFFVLVLLDNFNLATLFAVLIAILIGFALLPSITNLI
jgi:hypothetical protein